MPRWKERNISSFRRHQEEAALKWTDDEETRAVVLATVDAILEVIESHELKDSHLEAFAASATYDHANHRAWKPGVQRLSEMVVAFPERAHATVAEMLDDPRLAARFLSVRPGGEWILPDADREHALRTLAALSLDEQMALMPPADPTDPASDAGFDKVRLLLQQRESDGPSGSVEELLDELRTRWEEDGGREWIVIEDELAEALEPQHVGAVVELIEAWGDDGSPGNLVELVAEVDGGTEALLAAFERTPNDALIDFVFRGEEFGFDGESVLRRSLSGDLPPQARDSIASLLDGDDA